MINFTKNYDTSHKPFILQVFQLPHCVISLFFNNVSLVTGVYELRSFIWQNKCENIQICQPHQDLSLSGTQGFVSHPLVIKKMYKHINT